MKNTKTVALQGHAALLAANLLWGLMAPMAKAVLLSGSINAISLTTFRVFGAAILFWIASAVMKKEPVGRRDLIRLFFAALFGIILNHGAYMFGVSLTSPIDVSIVVTTGPIIAMIIAAFYLKEPMTGKKVGGVFLGAGGAILLIVSGYRSHVTDAAHSSLWGALLCLLSQFCFATYFVVFKELTGRYSPVTLMKWMFTYASVCMLPFSYTSIITIDFAAISPTICWDVLYVVVVGTFVTFMLLPVGQRSLRPTVGVMYNYVQPIVTSSVAVWWGMDTFGWMKGLAIGLIFLGVYVVTLSKSRAQMNEEL
ncbi:MAG: DMT family transporter [Prevotellaceae bacterium]|jgi:drug/metabolite transporter (DMT)-like permease|nr:DMT family transporter [Prevotellaceae bacterium]